MIKLIIIREQAAPTAKTLRRKKERGGVWEVGPTRAFRVDYVAVGVHVVFT